MSISLFPSRLFSEPRYSLFRCFDLEGAGADELLMGEEEAFFTVDCIGTLAVEMKMTAQMLSSTKAMPPMRNRYKATVSTTGNTLRSKNNLITIGLLSSGIVCKAKYVYGECVDKWLANCIIKRRAYECRRLATSTGVYENSEGIFRVTKKISFSLSFTSPKVNLEF